MQPRTLVEVGAILEQRRISQNTSLTDLLASLQMHRTTWYKWRDGEMEGGWLQMTRAALFLGITPNEIFVKDADTAEIQTNVLDAQEEAALAQIRRLCAQISRMTKGQRKPAQSLAQMLAECVAEFEPLENSKIPPGTEITAPEKGVRIYTPNHGKSEESTTKKLRKTN